MALALAAHHWKYCFREQRSSVTFAYNCAHIVPRNLVNRVVSAHFSFIVLKHRNHEVKLPLARPHCPAMADRRRPAEPAGVVPNTAHRWQAQKWSAPSRYVLIHVHNLTKFWYSRQFSYDQLTTILKYLEIRFLLKNFRRSAPHDPPFRKNTKNKQSSNERYRTCPCKR